MIGLLCLCMYDDKKVFPQLFYFILSIKLENPHCEVHKVNLLFLFTLSLSVTVSVDLQLNHSLLLQMFFFLSPPRPSVSFCLPQLLSHSTSCYHFLQFTSTQCSSTLEQFRCGSSLMLNLSRATTCNDLILTNFTDIFKIKFKCNKVSLKVDYSIN